MNPLQLLALLGRRPMQPSFRTPPFLPEDMPVERKTPPEMVEGPDVAGIPSEIDIGSERQVRHEDIPRSGGGFMGGIKRALPNMLQGAIAAGVQDSTGNTTKDIFQSLQAGMNAPLQRDMVLMKMRDQQAQIAREQAMADWYRTQAEYKPKQAEANVGLGQQRIEATTRGQDVRAGTAADATKEKAAGRKQSGVLGGIKAQGGLMQQGLEVQPNALEKAMGMDAGSIPMVSPVAKDNLSEPLKAKIGQQEAATGNTQAKTSAIQGESELIEIPAEIANAMQVPTLAGTKVPKKSLVRMIESSARNLAANGRAKEANEVRRYAANLGAATRLQVAKSGSGDEEDAKAIAKAIVEGRQSPEMTGLYRKGGSVRASLAKDYPDYNHAQATSDWKAIQRHLSTLNGPGQERLRQAVNFTYDSLDQIDELYEEWKKESATAGGGIKIFNRANLAVAKHLPGNAGATAQALEAQINDLTSELATVYKGGNSSTDESLRLAAENLKADWNEETFKKQMGQIRKNLQIRRNSIMTSQAVGVSPNSRYGSGAPQASPPGVTPRSGPQTPKQAPIVQTSKSTGRTRYSMDGGKTWTEGQPPR